MLNLRAFCRWNHQSHARKYIGSNADVGASWLLVTSTCTFCSGGVVVVVELFVKKQIETVLFDQVYFLQFAKETDVVGGEGMSIYYQSSWELCLYVQIAAGFLCGMWPCVHSSW